MTAKFCVKYKISQYTHCGTICICLTELSFYTANACDINCDSQARLSLDAQHKSLVEVAQRLNAKANLLDSAQLDHIEGRLTALAQKMDSINEKSVATPEDIERNQKVCRDSGCDISCYE